MTTDSRTRRTVGACRDDRFRGDVAAAAGLIGDGFAFRNPFVTSTSPTGHLTDSTSSWASSPAST